MSERLQDKSAEDNERPWLRHRNQSPEELELWLHGHIQNLLAMSADMGRLGERVAWEPVEHDRATQQAHLDELQEHIREERARVWTALGEFALRAHHAIHITAERRTD